MDDSPIVVESDDDDIIFIDEKAAPARNRKDQADDIDCDDVIFVPSRVANRLKLARGEDERTCGTPPQHVLATISVTTTKSLTVESGTSYTTDTVISRSPPTTTTAALSSADNINCMKDNIFQQRDSSISQTINLLDIAPAAMPSASSRDSPGRSSSPNSLGSDLFVSDSNSGSDDDKDKHTPMDTGEDSVLISNHPGPVATTSSAVTSPGTPTVSGGGFPHFGPMVHVITPDETDSAVSSILPCPATADNDDSDSDGSVVFLEQKSKFKNGVAFKTEPAADSTSQCLGLATDNFTFKDATAQAGVDSNLQSSKIKMDTSPSHFSMLDSLLGLKPYDSLFTSSGTASTSDTLGATGPTTNPESVDNPSIQTVTTASTPGCSNDFASFQSAFDSLPSRLDRSRRKIARLKRSLSKMNDAADHSARRALCKKLQSVRDKHRRLSAALPGANTTDLNTNTSQSWRSKFTRSMSDNTLNRPSGSGSSDQRVPGAFSPYKSKKRKLPPAQMKAIMYHMSHPEAKDANSGIADQTNSSVPYKKRNFSGSSIINSVTASLSSLVPNPQSSSSSSSGMRPDSSDPLLSSSNKLNAPSSNFTINSLLSAAASLDPPPSSTPGASTSTGTGSRGDTGTGSRGEEPQWSCKKCGNLTISQDITRCNSWHGCCNQCIQLEVKNLLARKKKGALKCVFEGCESLYSQQELKRALPPLLVEILEEKLEIDIADQYVGPLSISPEIPTTPDFANLDQVIESTKGGPSLVKLPGYWEPMDPEDTNYKLVQLDSTMNEFEMVTQMFEQTMARKFQIKKITRVQNPALYQFYCVKKSQMKRESDDGKTVEKLLFHGTQKSVTEAICKNNIDWRYSGKNATAFGKGSYFARDASFSHNYTDNGKVQTLQNIRRHNQNLHNMAFHIPNTSHSSHRITVLPHSQPVTHMGPVYTNHVTQTGLITPQIFNLSGHSLSLLQPTPPPAHGGAHGRAPPPPAPPQTHVMFLANVLVGKYTLGNQTLRRPPPLDQADPYGKAFDSCVNQLIDPTIFVVFDSSQIYPAFIIEYAPIGGV